MSASPTCSDRLTVIEILPASFHFETPMALIASRVIFAARYSVFSQSELIDFRTIAGLT